MKLFSNTAQFYKSKEWKECKALVLNERLKDGVLYCERCGKPILQDFNPQKKGNSGAVVYHHKIHLNAYNVNDASISLNPNNIAVLHWSCHNEEHQRFNGFQPIEKKVYIITGAPCSGKADYVKERAQEGDLILDVETIWSAFSGLEKHNKPNSLKPVIFKVRDIVKEMISKGAGSWRNAFIIECLPTATDRKREEERYKAFNVETITLNRSELECLERLHDKPNGRSIEEYEKYIRNYFEDFTE